MRLQPFKELGEFKISPLEVAFGLMEVEGDCLHVGPCMQVDAFMCVHESPRVWCVQYRWEFMCVHVSICVFCHAVSYNYS